jgi:hypothetical protein
MRKTVALFGLLFVITTAISAQSQASQGTAEPVAWMLFVDDLHLGFTNTGRLRDLVRTVLNALVRKGDVAAIRTPGPSSLMTVFRTPDDLISATKFLTGNGLRQSDIVAAPNDREVRYRMQTSLSHAAGAVAVLGQSEHARRALVFISEGYALDITEWPERRALAHTAGTNSVRIFVIDGRVAAADTTPSPQDPAASAYLTAARTSLQTIAEESGGFAVFDRDALPSALKQISSAVR